MGGIEWRHVHLTKRILRYKIRCNSKTKRNIPTCVYMNFFKLFRCAEVTLKISPTYSGTPCISNPYYFYWSFSISPLPNVTIYPGIISPKLNVRIQNLQSWINTISLTAKIVDSIVTIHHTRCWVLFSGISVRSNESTQWPRDICFEPLTCIEIAYRGKA